MLRIKLNNGFRMSTFRKMFYKRYLLVLLILLISSCGGGNGGSSETNSQQGANINPTVNAGDDFSTDEKTTTKITEL